MTFTSPDSGEAWTLVDQIWAQTSANGTLTILGKGEQRETRTHALIVEQAEDAARGLAQRGVQRGDRIGVVMSPRFDSVIGVLAAWRAGAAVLELPPPARFDSRAEWGQRTSYLLRRAAAALAIADIRWPESLAKETTRLEGLLGTNGPAPPGPTATDVAAIKFTSGSTSTPRGILKSHASMLAQARAQQLKKGGLDQQTDHRLGWIPLHSRSLGSIVLYPMAAGVSSTFLPPDLFGARPMRWLEEISRVRATFSSAPTFAYRLLGRQLEASGRLDLDLSSWRVAHCGGEAVDPAALDLFAAAANPYGFDASAFCVSYGLSETGGLTARPPGQGLRIDVVDRVALATGHARPATSGMPGARAITSVGSPAPNVTVKVVDEDGEELEDRRVGEVWAQTPGLMVGYLDDPEETAAVMQDGWLRTGDLGYIADGDLHITGRLKDVIIVHGRNYYADDIEHVVTAAAAVETAGCAALGIRQGDGESLVLVVEARDSHHSLKSIIRKTVWRQIGLTATDVALVPPGSLPRTANGKVQRGQARALYEAGTLVRGDEPLDPRAERSQ